MYLQKLFQKHMHERAVSVFFGTSIIMLGITGAIAHARLAGLTSPLIVSYDIFHGVNLIGSKFLIYNVVGIAFAIIAVNYLISRVILTRNIFLAYFVGAATVFISFVVLVGVSATVNFNV